MVMQNEANPIFGLKLLTFKKWPPFFLQSGFCTL